MTDIYFFEIALLFIFLNKYDFNMVNRFNIVASGFNLLNFFFLRKTLIKLKLTPNHMVDEKHSDS